MASLIRHRYCDVRPDNCRLNRRSPLWSSAQFLGLGQHADGWRYFNSRVRGPRGPHGVLTNMSPASDWGCDDRRYVSLDGVNDYVSLFLDHASYTCTPDVWKTLSIRFRSAGGTNGVLFGNPSGYNTSLVRTYGYGLSVKSDDTVRLTAGNNDGTCYDNVYASFSVNAWHTVTITVTGAGSGQTARLYLDGVLEASWTGDVEYYSWYADSAAIGVGMGTSNVNGLYFPGDVSDAMAFSEVLSDAVIQDMHEPANTMLRVGTEALMMPPSRVLWPAAVAGSTYPSTIELPAIYITI